MAELDYNVPWFIGWSVCVSCDAEAQLFTKGWRDEFPHGICYGEDRTPTLCGCEGSPYNSVASGSPEEAHASAQRHRDGYWRRRAAERQ